MIESLSNYVLEIRRDIIRKLVQKDAEKVKQLIQQTLQTKKFRTIYEIIDDYKSSSRKLKPSHKELLEDIKELLNTNNKETIEEILLFLSPRMDSLFHYFVDNIYGNDQQEISFEKDLYNDIVYYIFENNKRLALKEARKIKVENLSKEEIDQYAYIGLLKGIRRFNWTAGYKITTYVTYWIREVIYDAVKKNFMINYSEEVRQAYKEILHIAKKNFLSLTEINLDNLKEIAPEIFKKYKDDVLFDALTINWTYSIDYSDTNDEDDEENHRSLLDSYSLKVNNINYEGRIQYDKIYDIVKNILDDRELSIFVEEFDLDRHLDLNFGYVNYSKKDIMRVIRKIKSNPEIMYQLKEVLY